jgi:hypothetical protein
VLALLLAALACIACDIDSDFADQLVERTAERNRLRMLEQQREELPLPDLEQVRYIPMEAQRLEPRDDFRVELIDDLVLGQGHEEPAYLFARFSGRSAALGNVAVDATGRLYVLAASAREVRVFDPAGEFLFAFGRAGQGPADFEAPFGLSVAGERVHVFHRRFSASIWDLQGNFDRDRDILRTPSAQEAARLLDTAEGTQATKPSEARRRAESRRLRLPQHVIGRPDGSQIMVTIEVPEERSGRIATPFVAVVARYENGEEVHRHLEVPLWAAPAVAVAPGGELYVGMFGHLRTAHYVVALDAAGKPRWVLMLPWDVDMPPRADLRVDGEGRLFVFPNFYAPAEDLRSPVQVYRSDGELIGAGHLDRRPTFLHWQVTGPQGIYGVRVDPVSEEWQVVRYRLQIAE